MSLETLTFGIFASFVVASFVVGGFALLFNELCRLENKFDGLRRDLENKFDGLRRDLAEEFRAQRAEVLAQTTALANLVITAKEGR